jgi:hypothetical protein
LYGIGSGSRLGKALQIAQTHDPCNISVFVQIQAF